MTAAAELSASLATSGDPAKKEWWERYLKGAIEFYGVPMSEIRAQVRRWAADRDLGPAQLRTAAFDLLRRPVAEEKLAGILVMQERLLPVGAFGTARDLAEIARAFDEGHIADWNTTDWLCVRVLGSLIERDGEPTARRLADWTDAPVLWRRRAAAVSFVPVAAGGNRTFDGLVDMVIDVCAALVPDTERFAQTAVGWVMRDLSDAAPLRVYDFLEANRAIMSREALRMGAARLSDEQRRRLGISGKRRRR